MIEETIRFITSSPGYSPIDERYLTGFDYDILPCLESGHVLRIVSNDLTEDRECMYMIKVDVLDSVDSIYDVWNALRKSWECLRYDYYGASSFFCGDNKAELRFITIPGSDQVYVTGKIIIEGKNYERLVMERQKGKKGHAS